MNDLPNLKTVEESVYDAVFDILRDLERDEARRLFSLLVGKLTTDVEIGMSTVLKRRMRNIGANLDQTQGQ